MIIDEVYLQYVHMIIFIVVKMRHFLEQSQGLSGKTKQQTLMEQLELFAKGKS